LKLRLSIQLGRDSVEQITIENGWLLALEGLAFEDDLADVEAVSQQMREGSAGERNAAGCLARLQGAGFADDSLLAQLGHQQVQAAKLEI
jgi:hypothetical protein